jgi:hypothetical protein
MEIATPLIKLVSKVVSASDIFYQVIYRVFQKRFTTLKAYINLFRGHVQCFELS